MERLRRLMDEMKQEGCENMAYDPNIVRRAAARLEEQKRGREERLESLRRRVYAKEPRLAQLDRRIQGTMAELVASALRRGENAGEMVRTIRDKNLSLQRERSALLGTLGPAGGRPGRQAGLLQVRGIPAGGAPRCATA